VEYLVSLFSQEKERRESKKLPEKLATTKNNTTTFK
jgi:hypothetical protein